MRLVLEGGGVRAAYSAGVCKALIDCNVERHAVVGSSSGSVNAAFFASGQTDTLVKLWTEFVPGSYFISWRRQLTPWGGPGLGIDLMLDGVIMAKRYLDLDKATSGDPALFITATDVDGCSGKVARPVASNLIDWLRASLALPAAYNRIICVDGGHYIDGGVATPVPFDIEELAEFPGPTLVILTRHIDTKKRPTNWYERAFMHTIVPRRARKATLAQHQLHNQTMQRLQRALAEGSVIVSNPPPNMPISRLTTDKIAIDEGVHMGIEEGQRLAKLLGAAEPLAAS